MIIIGIDPGKGGGLALYDPDNPMAMSADKMPSTEKDTWEWFRTLAHTPERSHAYIERVHSTPQMGVKSAFTFGHGYGFLRGCMIGHGLPFEEVRPAQWMRAFGLKKAKTETHTQWKNRLKAKAQELFPHLKVTLGTADALLICEYGRRLRAGEVVV